MVVPSAHWPASKVKVYVLVPATAVLIVVGDQEPVIPSNEVPNNAPGVSPYTICS